jgi:hypothetical protein
VSPTDAAEMVSLSPTERLAWLLGQPALSEAHDRVNAVLGSYSRFLEGTDAAESTMIDRFLDPKISKEYFAAAHELGDHVFELLGLIGQGNPFHRLLVV